MCKINEDKIVVKVERFKTIQTDIHDSVIAMYNVMCLCMYICMYMQFEILIICSNSKTMILQSSKSCTCSHPERRI